VATVCHSISFTSDCHCPIIGRCLCGTIRYDFNNDAVPPRPRLRILFVNCNVPPFFGRYRMRDITAMSLKHCCFPRACLMASRHKGKPKSLFLGRRYRHGIHTTMVKLRLSSRRAIRQDNISASCTAACEQSCTPSIHCTKSQQRNSFTDR